ncbi:MAG TPA: HTTM domain-containing protein [Puia sp.]|nr:HTTM domain-containing protein [Puia sp.]
MGIKRFKHIAPLAVLRIAFGLVMLISTVRFIAKGWVYDFYIAPRFFFTFYGFEWVKPLGPAGMYAVFIVMAVAALFVCIGLFYRAAIVTFFVTFLYVELLDKSYYLNHYYFVSVFAFLMMLVPAHRYFSVDVLLKPSLRRTHVPAWMIDIFKAQLCWVYFCAGLAKLSHDWMIEAMPLKLWLSADGDFPVIGPLLVQPWVAFAFSWFGAVFDLTIGFFLWNKKTRPVAYVLVVIFHLLTGLLFKIGMFPYIMIAVTVIFFSEKFHRRLLRVPKDELFDAAEEPRSTGSTPRTTGADPHTTVPSPRWAAPILILFIITQLILPFRYLVYPGKLFWTEEGYRFSWRVMLMAKGGTAFFYVRDARTGRRWEVLNGQFLTPLQERMMDTQPDMILQYAHYLHDVYARKGIADPIINVESYVTLNGSGSRLFIDSTVDLAAQRESFLPKKWILPFRQ